MSAEFTSQDPQLLARNERYEECQMVAMSGRPLYRSEDNGLVY